MKPEAVTTIETAAKMPAVRVNGGWHFDHAALDAAEAAIGRAKVGSILHRVPHDETDKGVVIYD